MSQRYIGGLIYNPPGGYSGYFDGSGDYLTVPDNTAFDLGSGDFTFETWIFPTAAGTTGQFLISQWGSANYGYAISLVSSGSALTGIKFEYSQTGAVGNITARTYSQTIPLNAWSHIALVRASGTTTAYFNGAAVSTSSDNVTIYNSTATVHIAANPDGGINQTVFGYLSNLRLVKGTAVYTTAFTPPNGPLQNITNTSLLTCAYPTFRDGSSNAFTITVNGNTTVSTQNPFPLTTLPNPAQGGAGNGIFSMSQYQSLKQQNLWPTVDPYFDYTTLLLHGNGTNGGQNNTFLDSGTANGGVGFSITRNGDTTQGTFSPFSQTGWSNYFDGSGDYLTVPNSSSFAFGTGDFTIEFWFNTSTVLSDKIFLDFRNAGSSNNLVITTGGSSGPAGALRYASGVLDITSGSVSICNNGWNHCAAVRQSGTVRVYVNGVSTATGSDTSNFSSTSGTIQIGRNSYGGNEIEGYVSNLRIVKGTAVYTSNFTPPTAPLTNITNTSLLTCQSNRFIDNSTANSGSGFTLTVNGNTSVQAFSPFAPTAAYSASTVGGSGYFDGSGDYLQYPVITLGSSDVTAECWVYLNSLGNQEIFGINYNSDQSSYGAIRVQIASNTLRFMGTTSGSSFAFGPTSASKTPAIGEWAHIAVVRSGTTFTLYLNGTSVATATGISGSLYAGTFGGRVGSIYWSGGNDYLNGYVSNFRIVAGTAVYTGNFTPPTAPLTNITNTSLLLNFTNAAIIDNTANNDLVTYGNAQISTAQSKFGGGSILFNGTTDFIYGGLGQTWNFLTGPFTVECWIYFNSVASGDVFSNANSSGNLLNGMALYLSSSGTLTLYGPSVSGTATTSVSTGQWYHLAVTRSGNTFYLFKNGVQQGTFTDSGSITGTDSSRYFGIGRSASYSAAGWLSAYIDDFRITKGIARYTSNFTPQTSQWQDQ